MSANKPVNLVEETHDLPAERSSAQFRGWRPGWCGGWWGWGLATVALVLGFSGPLWRLARFAAPNSLYSHMVLVPFISLYLVWLRRKDWPRQWEPEWGLGVLGGILGGGLLLGRWLRIRHGVPVAVEDDLAWTTAAFLGMLFGVCGLFLGRQMSRRLAFPLGFLLFMVPFPVALRNGIETLLQHGSAAAAALMYWCAGTPFVRAGLNFQLPGISLEVAPECSGIHSSLVLFISSLLAGYLFLRSGWNRAILAFAVVPLAFLRNGFRVFVIGQLCMRLGPEIIQSPIHRQGGPLFFAVSLIPFFLLLIVLRRRDRAKSPQLNPNGA